MKRQNLRTVALIVVTLTYLLIGAAIFGYLESDYELSQRQYLEMMEGMVRKRYNITEDDYNVLTTVVIKSAPHKAGTQWQFRGALYFATTVVTTIGYGHSTPATLAGRSFCMVYALIGIPLGLVMFQSIGERLNTFVGASLKYVKRCLFKAREPEVTQTNLVMVVLVLSTILMTSMAAVFAKYERWDYLDALYYCFITLTTIGFGDYVALQKDSALQNKLEYFLLSLIFILFGLSVVSSAVNLLVLKFLTLNTEDERRDEQLRFTANLNPIQLEGDIISAPNAKALASAKHTSTCHEKQATRVSSHSSARCKRLLPATAAAPIKASEQNSFSSSARYQVSSGTAPATHWPSRLPLSSSLSLSLSLQRCHLQPPSRFYQCFHHHHHHHQQQQHDTHQQSQTDFNRHQDDGQPSQADLPALEGVAQVACQAGRGSDRSGSRSSSSSSSSSDSSINRQEKPSAHQTSSRCNLISFCPCSGGSDLNANGNCYSSHYHPHHHHPLLPQHQQQLLSRPYLHPHPHPHLQAYTTHPCPPFSPYQHLHPAASPASFELLQDLGLSNPAHRWPVHPAASPADPYFLPCPARDCVPRATRSRSRSHREAGTGHAQRRLWRAGGRGLGEALSLTSGLTSRSASSRELLRASHPSSRQRRPISPDRPPHSPHSQHHRDEQQQAFLSESGRSKSSSPSLSLSSNCFGAAAANSSSHTFAIRPLTQSSSFHQDRREEQQCPLTPGDTLRASGSSSWACQVHDELSADRQTMRQQQKPSAQQTHPNSSLRLNLISGEQRKEQKRDSNKLVRRGCCCCCQHSDCISQIALKVRRPGERARIAQNLKQFEQSTTTTTSNRVDTRTLALESSGTSADADAEEKCQSSEQTTEIFSILSVSSLNGFKPAELKQQRQTIRKRRRKQVPKEMNSGEPLEVNSD